MKSPFYGYWKTIQPFQIILHNAKSIKENRGFLQISKSVAEDLKKRRNNATMTDFRENI